MLEELFLLLATSAGGLYLLYILKPVFFFKFFISLQRIRAGVTPKYVKSSELRYSYSERGKPVPDQPTMLFIHGFSATKDCWNNVVKNIPDTHVILFDLPGHGDTDCPRDPDGLTLNRLKDSLAEFVRLLGLHHHTIHLVGSSLGSTVAALYAAEHPDHVKLLSVASPAMRTPVQTDFVLGLPKGVCPMITNTPEELDHLMSLTMYKKPKLPKQMLKACWQMRLSKLHFHAKMVVSIAKEMDRQEEICEKQLKQIVVPTQLFWGRQDQVMDVSGVELFQQYVTSVQCVHVMDECGHTVTIDQPLLVARLLKEFRQTL